MGILRLEDPIFDLATIAPNFIYGIRVMVAFGCLFYIHIL